MGKYLVSVPTYKIEVDAENEIDAFYKALLEIMFDDVSVLKIEEEDESKCG